MSNITVICPNCGALSNGGAEEDERKCSYCGIAFHAKRATQIKNAFFDAYTEQVTTARKKKENISQVPQGEKKRIAIRSAEAFQNAITQEPASLDGRFLIYGDAAAVDAYKGQPLAVLVFFEEHLYLVPLNQPKGKQPLRFLKMEDFIRMWPWYYPSHTYAVHLECRGTNHLYYRIMDDTNPAPAKAVAEYDLLLSDDDYVPQNPYLVVAGMGSIKNFTHEWRLSGKYDREQMLEILRFSQNRCRICGEKVQIKGLLYDKIICPRCGDVTLE